MVEDRVFPLIGDGKIQQAIAINIGSGNASRHLRISQTQISRKIDKSSGGRTNKEMIVVAAAQIIAGTKVRPVARMTDHVVVAHGQFVQLRPAIEAAFDKAGRLKNLQRAFVIEVTKANVPGPTAAGQSQRLAHFLVRSNTLLHGLPIARAQEDKVAFFQGEF